MFSVKDLKVGVACGAVVGYLHSVKNNNNNRKLSNGICSNFFELFTIE